ncbi:DMT family transporter [Streptomyces sp. NPDC006658]|uniref:DMT family transporter n=1 Tax=Streptomyces sp. NPDC006658 TaxID=3156900 RepID=UPI0033C7B807
MNAAAPPTDLLFDHAHRSDRHRHEGTGRAGRRRDPQVLPGGTLERRDPFMTAEQTPATTTGTRPTGRGADSARPVRIWLALGVALTLWASAFVGIKAVLHDFSPGPLVLLRFCVASAGVVAIWVVTARRRLRLPALRDLPLLLLCALLVIVVYNLGVGYGESTLSPGTASFIIGQAPVFSTVLAAFLLREKVAVLGWVGIGLGAGGTVAMLFADQAGPRINAGALHVLAAALAESLYFVLSKPLLGRYTSTEFNAFVTVLGTLMTLPYLGRLGHEVDAASAGSIAVVVYLGLFPAAVAYVLWNYAMTRLSVSTTTSALYALPFLTLVVSLLLLHTLPTALGLAGGLVSLIGAALVNSRRAR